MKITVAIPNFNGRDLLKKNLPNILESGANEILIIDDGSVDDSVELVKKEFPKVKLLINNMDIF